MHTIFYQQMVALYKDPNGEHVFDAVKETQQGWQKQNVHPAVERAQSNDALNTP